MDFVEIYPANIDFNITEKNINILLHSRIGVSVIWVLPWINRF